MVRAGSAAASPAASTHGLQTLEERNKWVNVTWMPHASLSQTSHVCLSIRSVLSYLDELKHFKPEEWQVRVAVHGVAGLPLVPVSSLTPTAPLTSMRNQEESQSISEGNATWLPLVSNVTHVCRLDSIVHVPMRWRDLTRDAYLKFEVLGHCDEVVSYSRPLPVFTKLLYPHIPHHVFATALRNDTSNVQRLWQVTYWLDAARARSSLRADGIAKSWLSARASEN